ncbi:MAG: O-methyltransferase [Bacteroidia bacterium]|nr:O-methyltransferase [Bacteroidia bacterium]
MESPQDKYIREHSTPQDEALAWIEKQTNIRTNYPRMLTGEVQGRLLTMLVEMCGAHDILEIGTFTGYSAVCLANGTPEDGHVDTLEINDELEDIIKEGWERAGVSGKITLHLGDALDTLKALSAEGRKYDLVYVDANKREYPDYYKRCIEMLRPGGVILADDVMLGGKVYAEKASADKQTKGLLEFNDFVVADPSVEVVMLPIRDGLSVIRKKL